MIETTLGRPPPPLGTFGKIHFVDLTNGVVQARTSAVLSAVALPPIEPWKPGSA
jgi:hypothetical protein